LTRKTKTMLTAISIRPASIDDSRRTIENFASGDDHLRLDAISAWRRFSADPAFRSSFHARYMSEIVSGAPDYPILAYLRRRLVPDMALAA
jgi:hypothetical protein